MKKLYQSIFSSKPYALLIICFLLVVKLQAQVSLIGLATPYNNTVSDYDMVENPVNSGKWSASVYLTANTVKFRLNHSNTTTWGGTDLPTGVADVGGPNFNLTSAGFYVVHFNTNTKQYSFFADGKVGINNNDPKTALDVSGAVTIRPLYLSVVSNTLTIPDNVGNVVINQGGSTGAFTIGMASYTEGQRLIIDNLTPHGGTLAGTVDVPPTGISEFVVSDGEWKLITNNPATPSNSWKIVGNGGINATTNFLGTTDNKPLSFRINNSEKMKLVTDGLQLNQTNFLEFGAGTTKEVNAGKIGYGLFTPQTLDIVGAGTQNDNRKIRFWAEAGSTFEGGASFAKGVGISASPIDGKLQINSSTASIASIAIKDSMTNSAGHISFRNVNNVLQGMDMKVNTTGTTGSSNNISLNTASNIYNLSQTFYGNGHTTVAGNLTIGDDANTPVAGTMRFNSANSDFEGYNGTEWKSLTKHSSWGTKDEEIAPNQEITASNLDNFVSLSITQNVAAVLTSYATSSFPTLKDTIRFYDKNTTTGVWTVGAKLARNMQDIVASPDGVFVSAINANYLVVGQSNKDGTYTNQGRVYIFSKVGGVWAFEQEIFSPTPFTNEYFGSSVAIHNNTLIVGATGDDFFAPNKGAVYIFEKIGAAWVYQQKLIGSVPNEYFGNSVAIDVLNLLIGSPGAEKARLYTKIGGTWQFSQQFIDFTGTVGDLFGNSVSISGNYFVIGAPNKNIYGPSPYFRSEGRAFVFKKNVVWNQILEVISPYTGPTVSSDFSFGTNAKISNNNLAIQSNKGIFFYSLLNNNWNLIAKDFYPDPNNGSSFFFDEFLKFDCFENDVISLFTPGNLSGYKLKFYKK